MSSTSTRHIRISHRARNLGIGVLTVATVAGSTAAAYAQTQPGQTTTPDVTYADGTYTGISVRADHWGSVQVAAIIEDGQLTNFQILDYPRMRRESLRISQAVLPYLMQEAVTNQSADLDLISGATPTSAAFLQSLQSALDQAAGIESNGTTTSTGVNL